MSESLPIILLLAALAATGAALWFAQRSAGVEPIRAERDRALRELEGVRAENTRLASELAAAKAATGARSESEEARFLALAQQALEASQRSFMTLANETFSKHKEAAQGGVKEVLAPAQEALARGCAHWRRVRAMDDQRAWFTRVALNLANSRWRRLRVERSKLGSLAEPTPSPADDMALALTVRAAVRTLTPRQRMAVVLRYFEDLDLSSAAMVMGCSPSTTKKLTARGLAALRQQLDLDETLDGGER